VEGVRLWWCVVWGVYAKRPLLRHSGSGATLCSPSVWSPGCFPLSFQRLCGACEVGSSDSRFLLSSRSSICVFMYGVAGCDGGVWCFLVGG